VRTRRIVSKPRPQSVRATAVAASQPIVAVDVGTTVTKVALWIDGQSHYQRIATPWDPRAYAPPYVCAVNHWWDRIVRSMRTLLTARALSEVSVLSISTISPVPVMFNASGTTAVAVPYWTISRLPPGTTRAEWLHWCLTNMRALVGRPAEPMLVSDLAGYFVYRACGQHAISPINAAELSLRDSGSRLVSSSVPAVRARIELEPGEAIFDRVAARAIVHTTDSHAVSLVGDDPGGGSLLYLGTFGGLLSRASGPRPYRWLVSCPRFGAEIDAFVSSHFSSRHPHTSMTGLAKSRPSGANGFLLQLPVWDNAGVPQGAYRLHDVCLSHRVPTLAEVSRTYSEALCHCVLSIAESYLEDKIYLAGGGATDHTLGTIMATLLRRPVVVQRDKSGTLGTYLYALEPFERSAAREAAIRVADFSQSEMTDAAVASYAKAVYAGIDVRSEIA
jgi:hypothetical protein